MERPDFVLLLDIYGELLSEGQKQALDMRYNADLSLSEMAEELGGVSRQSASCSVKSGEKKLLELEDKLGLAGKLRTLSKKLNAARVMLGEIRSECGESDSGRFDELDRVLSEIEQEL